VVSASFVVRSVGPDVFVHVSDLLERPRVAVGDEVEYEIALPGDGAQTEVFFSDLSADYVALNAHYTT